MAPQKLSVLVTQELVVPADAPAQSWWVAQIIEQDLATQARTLADLLPEIQRLIVAYMVSGREMDLELWTGPAAPEALISRFEAAPIRLEWLPDPETTPGVMLPELDIRIGT